MPNSISLPKFILYRSLLKDLGSELPPPNELVASMMGIGYGNYRQIDSRSKKDVKEFLQTLENGRTYELDESSKHLVKRVDEDFDNLAEIVHEQYMDSLATLDYEDNKALMEGLQAYIDAKEYDYDYNCDAPSFSLKVEDSGCKYSVGGFDSDLNEPSSKKAKRSPRYDLQVDEFRCDIDADHEKGFFSFLFPKKSKLPQAPAPRPSSDKQENSLPPQDFKKFDLLGKVSKWLLDL